MQKDFKFRLKKLFDNSFNELQAPRHILSNQNSPTEKKVNNLQSSANKNFLNTIGNNYDINEKTENINKSMLDTYKKASNFNIQNTINNNIKNNITHKFNKIDIENNNLTTEQFDINDFNLKNLLINYKKKHQTSNKNIYHLKTNILKDKAIPRHGSCKFNTLQKIYDFKQKFAGKPKTDDDKIRHIPSINRPVSNISYKLDVADHSFKDIFTWNRMKTTGYFQGKEMFENYNKINNNNSLKQFNNSKYSFFDGDLKFNMGKNEVKDFKKGGTIQRFMDDYNNKFNPVLKKKPYQLNLNF